MITRALKIVIIYAFSGILWISISDAIFFTIEGPKAYPVVYMGSLSALIFLTVTGFILFKLIGFHYKRLQNSEQQYKTYFDSNPTPMWIYDIKTLKFIRLNDAAIANYGYTKHEFHHLTILDIHPSEEQNEVFDMINNFKSNYNNAGTWKHKKKDGSKIYVHITSNLIFTASGRQVMMMANDITKRIQTEQHLKKMNGDLVRQNALLTDIAWSQSHDIRRPLASIMGLINLLRISDNDNDKQQCIEFIEQSASDLDLMIKNIANEIDLFMFKD